MAETSGDDMPLTRSITGIFFLAISPMTLVNPSAEIAAKALGDAFKNAQIKTSVTGTMALAYSERVPPSGRLDDHRLVVSCLDERSKCYKTLGKSREAEADRQRIIKLTKDVDDEFFGR